MCHKRHNSLHILDYDALLMDGDTVSVIYINGSGGFPL